MQQSRDDVPEAYVQHSLAGRVRLRVPARRGDHAFFARVATALTGAPGLDAVATNPLTGSILIRHRGPVEPILAGAEGLFTVGLPPPNPALRRPGVPRRAGMVHPLSMAAAGFAVLATYQVARGRFAGTATENLWTAYNALRRQTPVAATGLAAAGLVQLARGRMLSPAISLAYYAYSAHRLARGRQ